MKPHPEGGDSGPVRDHAHPHALPARVQALGFELLGVRRLPIAREREASPSE